MHIFKSRCAINIYSVAVLHCCLISACHWVSDTSRRVLTAVGSTEQMLPPSAPVSILTPGGRRSCVGASPARVTDLLQPPPCQAATWPPVTSILRALSVRRPQLSKLSIYNSCVFSSFFFLFYCAPIVKKRNCGFVPAIQALSRCYANHNQQMDFPLKDGHF